jgi:ATP-dependent metalloprotease
MCGPPGTGKTLMARAMAGEAGVPFLYCAGSAFDEVYVGVGSKRVRQLFHEAAANAPCIVFIDEIDAVGASRETSNKDSTLQQLLTELDGFGSTQGVVVIAATNTPETLDPALVRPGRFDRQVFVPLPDVKGRKQIFDMYLKKVAASDAVDSELLARSTPGFSGADINQLINASAIKAVISGKGKITMDVIDEAKDDVLMGRMRKSVIIDQRTREITAYHEGGHALVAYYTEGADPVHKATIIQRGSALGMVKQLPTGDQLSYNRQQMEARLSVLMAGRAAEDLIYGRMGATSGASSDLKQASKLAAKMVKEWGFSDKVGLVYVANKVSSQTDLLIDQEVHDLLHRQYDYAKTTLEDHREELHLLAKALLDKETLSGKEITELLCKK